MAVIQNPGDFPQVRAALDLELTEAGLPDAKIALPIFLDATEQWVADTIPDPSGLSPADTNRLHRAAVWHLAGLLAPSLPSVVRRGDRDVVEQLVEIDRQKQAADLLGRAEGEIRSIVATSTSSTAVMPTQMIVPVGTRGR